MRMGFSTMEKVIGSARVVIRSGELPPTCESRDNGDVLAAARLPDTWITDPRPFVFEVTRAGEPGHFRVYGEDASCVMQGTVSDRSDGVGDMLLDVLDQHTPGRLWLYEGQRITMHDFRVQFAST